MGAPVRHCSRVVTWTRHRQADLRERLFGNRTFDSGPREGKHVHLRQVSFGPSYLLTSLLALWLFQEFVLSPLFIQANEIPYSEFRAKVKQARWSRSPSVTSDRDKVLPFDTVAPPQWGSEAARRAKCRWREIPSQAAGVGAPQTLHMNRRAETQTLDSGTINRTAPWGGPQLIVAYEVGHAGTLHVHLLAGAHDQATVDSRELRTSSRGTQPLRDQACLQSVGPMTSQSAVPADTCADHCAWTALSGRAPDERIDRTRHGIGPVRYCNGGDA